MLITLGDRVKDIITGFEGVAIAKVEYLNGCIQYQVRPTGLKDGQPRDAHWIDISQLGHSPAGPGGPQDAPTSFAHPPD